MSNFVQAHSFTDASRDVGDIKRLVAHTAEIQETRDAAEDVAAFFAKPTTGVSAHKCVDNNTVVTCVFDEDIAHHAKGDNLNSIGYEMSGFAKQTKAQWLDEYSRNVIERTARNMALDCIAYNIPPRWLTEDQLRADMRGIVSHMLVSKVLGDGGRTDPGAEFPVQLLIAQIKDFITEFSLPPRVKFQLGTGEGQVLATSAPCAGTVEGRAARLERFISAQQIEAMVAEFDRDKKQGEVPDVRIIQLQA